jgi:hypothetical protein
MHRTALLVLATVTLAACGSKAEAPVEKIVVRQPGPAATPSPAPAPTAPQT